MDVERLYREIAPALFRYLTRFAGDEEVAADAVQETFVRLVERKPTGDGVKAWLFRVGTNLVLERRRSESRRWRILRGGEGKVPVGDAPVLPDAAAEAAERAKAVRTALEALPERDRTVLLLRAEGFAYHEIAEAVGTTTGSVGTILIRAMRKLERELERAGQGGTG